MKLNEYFFDDIKYRAGELFHKKELSKFLINADNAYQKLAEEIIEIFEGKNRKRMDAVEVFFQKNLHPDDQKTLCAEISKHPRFGALASEVNPNSKVAAFFGILSNVK